MTLPAILAIIQAEEAPQTQIFSIATAVAAVAGAAGGIFASLVEGLAAQRLEHFGRVSIWPKEWFIVYVGEDGGVVDPAAEEKEIAGAHYAVNVRFFNRKRVATGFRDSRVEFSSGGPGVPLKHVPDDPDKPVPGGDDGSVEYEKADLINLPSREFVLQRLRGRLGPEDARKVRRYEVVEFVGILPSDTERRVKLDPSE